MNKSAEETFSIPEHNSQATYYEYMKSQEDILNEGEEGDEPLPAQITCKWELDNVGNIVLNREFVPELGMIKVDTKLTYGSDNYPETKGELEKLSDYTYFRSAVDGSYIGTEEIVNFLTKKMGITYIHNTNMNGRFSSNIGFNPTNSKWYGWSHRAIYGFTVGDEVHEGDLTNMSGFTDEYLAGHPEEDMSLPIGFKAEILEDAKRMAIAFAEAVS